RLEPELAAELGGHVARDQLVVDRRIQHRPEGRVDHPYRAPFECSPARTVPLTVREKTDHVGAAQLRDPPGAEPGRDVEPDSKLMGGKGAGFGGGGPARLEPMGSVFGDGRAWINPRPQPPPAAPETAEPGCLCHRISSGGVLRAASDAGRIAILVCPAVAP